VKTRAVAGEPGPNYDLVRRFYSHPPERSAIDWLREQRGLLPATYHCFSVCEYCGYLVPEGIDGVVCCHERAVRHGTPAPAAIAYAPQCAKSDRMELAWFVFLALLSAFAIWRGVWGS
jgi:hypothetical protein